MKPTLKPVSIVILTLLLLAFVACTDSNVTLEPSPTPAQMTEEVAPSATIPPVASPTIIIPEVTKVIEPTEEAVATAVPEPAKEVAIGSMPLFARFKPAAVDVTPAMFQEPIAADLGNVLVPFPLSSDQLARLGQSGVVVSPGQEKEFFTVYEKARYDNVPIFVTSDSLLHSYHLIFDKVLRTAERQYFIPLLHQLNQAVLAEADAQYQALRGTSWEDAALRTVAFVGVGARLLDPEIDVPAYALDLVEEELALVEAAGGIQPSPLFPGLEFGEDYTQYIPRGHYTLSEDLKAYFKSMMWYGRMTFRLKTRDPEVGRAETRSALLLVHALRNARVGDATVGDRPALDAWLDLYNPTAFLVGRSDDLTAFQYLEVINDIYGPTPTLQEIADESQLETFIEAAEQLPPPRILGLVISETDDEVEETKGFRFMGQRFVPDAYVFRQLIWRNVGTNAQPRQLPKGLDVMAAMGSERAYAILTDLGETEYDHYPEQMAKMQNWMASLTEEEWSETLYNGWLYTLRPLLDPPGEGYPQFMQSEAWLDKQLSTSLGSWAELKHDTILYAKQAYAEMGGGGYNPPRPKDAIGYVEPVPEFYARLSALAVMTRDGLLSRGLLGEKDANSLERIIRLSDAFQVMAEKELRGEPLTEEEAWLILVYGGELEHLVMASGDVPDEDPAAQPLMDEEPQAAIIADVATAPDYVRDGVPDPTVLEVGVGRVDEIYVVVPAADEDGSIFLQVAKGGVFSYYEFPWPATDRLTDEKWRGMLDGGEAPERPTWIDSFFTGETEYAGMQRAIYTFEKTIPFAYWGDRQPDASWTEDIVALFADDLEALRAANQYIGRQWISANYRDFDLQSPDLAVVTVRETWDDTLYEQLKEMPDFDDPVIGHRGPYTLDVVYTLARTPDGWQVTRLVYTNEPPGWE